MTAGVGSEGISDFSCAPKLMEPSSCGVPLPPKTSAYQSALWRVAASRMEALRSITTTSSSSVSVLSEAIRPSAAQAAPGLVVGEMVAGSAKNEHAEVSRTQVSAAARRGALTPAPRADRPTARAASPS